MTSGKTIPTQTSCMDEYDPNSLSVSQALDKIHASVSPIECWEKVAIRDALNRVIFEDITSPLDIPPYTNSAMDGYALSGHCLDTEDETIELRVIGKILAGTPFEDLVTPEQCVRIMTGGKMPHGTDTVIMQEQVETRGEGRIAFNNTHKPGQHVRQAGEDIKKGSVVLRKGQFVNPAELGLMASLGISEILVYRRVRVTFFSTGDELQSVGNPLQEGQIYDSNRYTLFGMLQRFGAQITDMGTIADEPGITETTLLQASRQSDLIITSGGVSVGEADYIKLALDKLGIVNFWRIAMKPRKPLAYGKINQALFFGLPGNPVSTMVTFYQFVLPALHKLSGRSMDDTNVLLSLPCVTPVKKNPGRKEYQRGIMEYSADGKLQVRITGAQGSGILSSMSQANCFVILDEECAGLEAGSVVQVQPFKGLM